MYNILINNLSLVSINLEHSYVLDFDETKNIPEEKRTINGVYTNEPVTHALLRKFKDDEQGEKLDLIYSLVTNSVLTEPISVSEKGEQLVKKYSGLEYEEALHFSHYKFYKKMIDKMIAGEWNLDEQKDIAEIQRHRPEFDSENIPDLCEPKDTHTAVVHMATSIIEIYKEHNNQCRLYLDYTGGDRTMSTIMIALTKMLEEHNINVDHIWAVCNFNEIKTKHAIRERKEVNYIFDFISGLQEFNNYGRANILNDFLHESGIELSESAKNVQEKISSLADTIQLCWSGNMENSIGQLANAVKNYEKDDLENRNEIFDYLIEDIKSNYGELLERGKRTVPNIISWCLDKSLIQQAATMYAERLPRFLCDKKIIYFKGNEWEQYIEPEKKKNYERAYNFFNYYIWQHIALDKLKSDKDYDDRAKKLSEYITEKKDGSIGVKEGLKKEQVEILLLNYMQFKSLIRHPLNHAQDKGPKIKNIHEKMHWKNESEVFGDKDQFQKGTQNMTVQLLTRIMRDLLLQLQDLL